LIAGYRLLDDALPEFVVTLAGIENIESMDG
jgi:hypothetical protein